MVEEGILRDLEKIMGLKEMTLSGSDNLKEIEGWDSLAVLDFIAMIDRKFGKLLAPSDIEGIHTVDELIALAER